MKVPCISILVYAAFASTGPVQAGDGDSKTTLAFDCINQKHHIIVDQNEAKNFRYRSWNQPRLTSSKPDLELKNGNVTVEGTGPCRYETFEFSSKGYRYRVGGLGCTDGSEPSGTIGRLEVYKKKPEGLHSVVSERKGLKRLRYHGRVKSD